MGTRHVYLIIVFTEYIRTYHFMAAKEDVSLTLGVIVDRASASDATCRVGIGGLEGNDTMRVHRGTKGGEIGEAGGGEVG